MSVIYTNRSQAGAAQVNERDRHRRVHNVMEGQHAAILRQAGDAVAVNAVIGPQQWLELDAQVVQLIGQETDVIFRDLQPLARSISIGKFVAAYRQLGDIDAGETSITGQVTHLMGNTGHQYGGILVPVHSKAFGRGWRETEAARSIGMDELGDDQAAATREVLRLMTVNMIDGNPGLNYQGFGAYGLKTNPATMGITLQVDFTSATTTFAQADAEFNRIMTMLRSGGNRVGANFNVYISAEIEARWRARSGAQTIDRTWLEIFRETPGVAKIEVSELLVSNEIAGFVPNAAYIQPLIGQAVGTTPVARTAPFADFQFITWSASGLQIKADADGRTGVFYAAS
jgi:hypothetical protein